MDNLIKVSEACRIKGCSQYAIRTAIASGRIDFVDKGRRTSQSGSQFYVVDNERFRNIKFGARRGVPNTSPVIEMKNGVQYRNDLLGQETQRAVYWSTNSDRN